MATELLSSVEINTTIIIIAITNLNISSTEMAFVEAEPTQEDTSTRVTMMTTEEVTNMVEEIGAEEAIRRITIGHNLVEDKIISKKDLAIFEINSFSFRDSYSTIIYN